MLFNSAHFFIFFPVVIAAFFLLPHRLRWILLVAASYYFYMAFRPEYALLLLFLTVVDYWAALLMDRTNDRRRRMFYLYGSLISNLGLLFFFKYFDFFNENIAVLLNSFNIFYDSLVLNVLLPIGISFHVFQSLSYTIDVYHRVRPAERHFGIYALYVSFFPQLVAGPIERSTHLLPQFYKQMTFDPLRLTSGLRLMLWGFFLKVVIADNAGRIVDMVYADPSSYGGLALIMATFFFSMQIFGDFAGYSYIAIGSARAMGFDLMANFKRPYLATSIGEFWRRWHMSLMSWFRDYLYIPLGGSYAGTKKWVRNIFIVFFISGLWHGANWTFVIWGLLNAVYVVVSRITGSIRSAMTHSVGLDRVPKLHTFLRIIVVFFLVNIAWIFFRAENLSSALMILARIASDLDILFRQLTDPGILTEVVSSFWNGTKREFIGLITAIIVLVATEAYEEWGDLKKRFYSLPSLLRIGVYYALLLFIVFFGYFGARPFIYFQF